jgi:hypothetical protein
LANPSAYLKFAGFGDVVGEIDWGAPGPHRLENVRRLLFCQHNQLILEVVKTRQGMAKMTAKSRGLAKKMLFFHEKTQFFRPGH